MGGGYHSPAVGVKICPIIYAAKNTETQQINIIRGYVLMDLSNPLPEFIPIAVAEAPDKVMKQRIRYLRLPDACFICRQRGHFAHACPLEAGRRNQTDGDNIRRAGTRDGSRETRGGQGLNNGEAARRPAEADNSNPAQRENSTEFQTVRRRTKPKFQTPEIKKSLKVDNRYGVLEDKVEERSEAREPVEKKVEVRSRRYDMRDLVSQEKDDQGEASSSSIPRNTSAGQSRDENSMLIQEIIDITKTKDPKNQAEESTPRLAGGKHQ
ncbi:hypothetical protein R1sor_010966 [Riccia sorocarpa]|uniref:CCHC-type domain-containing protein n=1 Tax=Riccia sorocarpa TaxID=122646 RepID=A0ABD3I3F1_9MARC